MSRPASFLEPEEGATIAIQTKVQKCGILSKKPFGHQSSKWSKRFFILKDGFILWYAEKDAKEFAKTGIFNIHPKAAIPLGGCYVDEIDDKHNKHVLRIMHADFGGGVLCLAADSAESLQDWKKWITDCGRVTWKNAQIGDTMIACLKAKGDIFKEKKEDTEEKLKEEALALAEERFVRERIEVTVAQLKEDKEKMEDDAKQLREMSEAKESEIEQTRSVMEQLELKKADLESKAAEMQAAFDEERTSRVATEEAAGVAQAEQQRLASEKAVLGQATADLVENLKRLQAHAVSLREEKQAAEEKLKKAKLAMNTIAAEMTHVAQSAQHLEEELQTAAAEKETALEAVEAERQARITAEGRLRVAETALVRLDRALRESGVKMDVGMTADVNKLKSFFEEALSDEQFKAQMPTIMKDALTARTDYERTGKDL